MSKAITVGKMAQVLLMQIQADKRTEKMDSIREEEWQEEDNFIIWNIKWPNIISLGSWTFYATE